jgi:hypothetical protein
MPTIVGISGYARSGKDLFTTVAQNILNDHNLKSERYALAYELKSDLKDLVEKKTGINVFTENTKEKAIIRPLLVAYGEVMRKISNGTYWTQKIESRIAKSTADVIFITDIRYDMYPEDECTWVKHKQSGKLVHLTKFKMSPAPSKRRISTSKPVKIYDGAPNDHELFNNPKVKSKSDVALEWEDYSDKLNGIKLEDHPYIKEKVTEVLKKIKLI